MSDHVTTTMMAPPPPLRAAIAGASQQRCGGPVGWCDSSLFRGTWVGADLVSTGSTGRGVRRMVLHWCDGLLCCGGMYIGCAGTGVCSDRGSKESG